MKLSPENLMLALTPDQIVTLTMLDIVIGYCAWPAALVTVAVLAKRVLDAIPPPPGTPTQANVKPRQHNTPEGI